MINHVIRSSIALLKLASTLDGSHLLSRLSRRTILPSRSALSTGRFSAIH
jgi:hypothetical protein